MLDLQVLRISQILDLEETLYLGNTLGCQINYFILLIYDEIACLLTLYTHDGIHLGQFFHILTTLQLSGQNITCLIQLCGLTALTGNNKWGSRLIDQYRVNLIDDSIMQIS